MRFLRNLGVLAGAGLCAFQVGGCSLMDISGLLGGVIGG